MKIVKTMLNVLFCPILLVFNIVVVIVLTIKNKFWHWSFLFLPFRIYLLNFKDIWQKPKTEEVKNG